MGLSDTPALGPMGLVSLITGASNVCDVSSDSFSSKILSEQKEKEEEEEEEGRGRGRGRRRRGGEQEEAGKGGGGEEEEEEEEGLKNEHVAHHFVIEEGSATFPP